MKSSRFKLIIFVITNSGLCLLLHSVHPVEAAESTVAPTNDSAIKESAQLDPTNQHHLEQQQQQQQQATDTFNLMALANTIQDSANNSSGASSSYHLIDSGGSLTDPKVIYQQQLGGHANHRNYPGEPYPSASYTSSVLLADGSPHSNRSSSSNLALQAHNHQARGNFHSHSASEPIIVEQPAVFMNSFGNQSPSSTRNNPHYSDHNYYSSYQQHQHQNNHNYHNQAGNNQPQLNTGLIQNLTAALFPVRQISNATLQTLSDLLNKTRHSNSNNYQQPTYQQHSSRFRQAAPQANYNHVYTNFYSPSMSSSSMVNSLADNDVRLPQFNGYIFDQIRQASKFGFREPSALKQHAANSALQQHQQRPLSADSSEYQISSSHSSKSGPATKGRISSNIYNTYAPFGTAGSSSGSSSRDISSSSNILPLLTSGQSLNHLAASLLANGFAAEQQQQQQQQLDLSSLPPDGMRLSSAAPSQHHHHNHQYNSLKQASSSSPSTASNYNYIQHHQGAQNHLDKVVYHSTPFRPSIVSPPASMAGLTAAQPSSSPAFEQQQQHQQQHQQQQQSYAGGNHQHYHGNKSMSSFGTLSSPSVNSISDTRQPSNSADAYVSPISGSPYSSNSTRFLTGPTINTSEKQVHPVSVPSFNSTSQMVANLSSAASATADSSLAANGNKATPSQTNTLAAPSSSALLDIYEREIDQQIRDAFLGESGNILSTMASRLVQTPSSTGVGIPGWSSYDEPAVDQSLLASWIRAANPMQSQSPLSLTSSSHQIEHFARPSDQQESRSPYQPTVDLALSDALHELPTFSAADLQPIFPSSLSDQLAGVGSSSSYFNSHSNTNNNSRNPNYAPMASASQESALEQSIMGPVSWPYSASGFTTAPSLNAAPTGEEAQNALSQSLQQIFGGSNSLQQTLPVTTGRQQKPRNQQQQNYFDQSQASQQQQQQSLGSNNGLPSIFYKLNPLAPFLSNPFNHLYSSLPRNRNNSKVRSPSSGGGHRAASQIGNNPYRLQTGVSSKSPTPGESRLKQQYANHPVATSSKHQRQQLQIQQQQQQQQLASLLANLIAASSAPSQQTHLNQGSYASSGTSSSSLMTPVSQLDTIFDQLPADQGAQQTVASQMGLSLAGGGISPLLWRALFPSTTIQRGQPTIPKGLTSGHTNPIASAAPAINSFLAQTYYQQPAGSQSASSSLSPSSSMLPLVNAGPGSSRSAAALQQANRLPISQSRANLAGAANLKPKLKIRILKIPIAVYDSHPAAGGGQSTAVGLLPAGQMEAAASLLANLPCPIRHDIEGDGQQMAPHTIDKHLLNGGGSSTNLSTLFDTETLSSMESTGQPAIQTSLSLSQLDHLVNGVPDLQDTGTTATFLQEKLLQMLN